MLEGICDLVCVFDYYRSGCQVVNKESVIRKLYDENVSAQEIMRKWRETLDSLPKPKGIVEPPQIVICQQQPSPFSLSPE